MVGEPAEIEVNDLDWDHQNVEHIARHDVGPMEVEFVLGNEPRFFLNKPGRSATHVMVGEDQWGRVLFVPILCVEWPTKWRVISAWESRVARKLLPDG